MELAFYPSYGRVSTEFRSMMAWENVGCLESGHFLGEKISGSIGSDVIDSSPIGADDVTPLLCVL